MKRSEVMDRLTIAASELPKMELEILAIEAEALQSKIWRSCEAKAARSNTQIDSTARKVPPLSEVPNIL
jgi:hypothetical protein